MIRAGATSDTGRPLVILGISEGNVQRLKEGNPIHIHADELGFSGDIVIFYGETEDAMAEMMKPFVDPNAVRDRR